MTAYDILTILLAISLSAYHLSPLAPQLPAAVLLQEQSGIFVSTADAEVQESLQFLIEQEAQASRSGNWALFQSLVHPNAAPGWLQQQQDLFATTFVDIRVTRTFVHGEWALAAVIETFETGQFYTTRTFRQSERSGWKLTSPALEAWGEQHSLVLDLFHLTYYTFDAPYIHAIAPEIEPVLLRMGTDFGIAVTGDEPFDVQVMPVHAAAEIASSTEGTLLTVASPLSPGFPMDLAQTPEEFLLGLLSDTSGIALIKRTYGEKAEEQSRLYLAYTAVQWEVEQAVHRDNTHLYLADVARTPARTPLTSLLDPTTIDYTASQPSEKHLFTRFAVESYGRSIIAPFLQAVFEMNSAEELIQSAFDMELNEVEEEWRVWLNQQLRDEEPW
jgi:hypothetical protein